MLWELSESDLERIEETASSAISIHSSFLTTRVNSRGGKKSNCPIWFAYMNSGAILPSLVAPNPAPKLEAISKLGTTD